MIISRQDSTDTAKYTTSHSPTHRRKKKNKKKNKKTSPHPTRPQVQGTLNKKSTQTTEQTFPTEGKNQKEKAIQP